MSDSTVPLTTTDGVRLRLVRPAPPDPEDTGARKPVLLLHGASAGSNTFTTGAHAGGLASWLAEHRFDPWLLEWRGSGQLIADGCNKELLETQGGLFTFNGAAEHDVTCALERIRNETGAPAIAIVGFCMGSGILAEAIARGMLTNGPRTVDCVVLMTLGLFYETPPDGRLKSEERILERLKGTRLPGNGVFVALNPRMRADAKNGPTLDTPWPRDLDRLYGDWPGRLKSHGERARYDSARNERQERHAPETTAHATPPMVIRHGNSSPEANHVKVRAAAEMCNRLGFLYGTPYYHPNLVAAIHGDDTTEPLLSTRFGAIPLDMFIHAGRNVRRGIATIYDCDPTRARLKDRDLVSNRARQQFHELKKVTLITGDRNQLWHRNSIDLMHEWLRRGAGRDRIVKHVMPDYGHQDLLWGVHAPEQVYGLVGAGLTEDGRLPYRP
jgi:pimeloyl-ACP methyl ester carboxylesterase